MKHNYIVYLIGIIGLAALVIMLNATSPTEIGPSGVLLFFTTIYITIFSIFTILWQLFGYLAFKKKELKRKDYLYTAVLSFTPIMLLMIRAFGAISIWTVGLVVFFTILAEFLVYKKI